MVPSHLILSAIAAVALLTAASTMPRSYALSAERHAAGCSIGSPFRPFGVTIRNQGTKAPVKVLVARDRRSPLTTRRMSRIAKGSYYRARCSQEQALAQIANSGGLRFRSELPAMLASGRAAGGVDANAGAFLPERGFVMRNRIDIDSKHSRAIVQEIGERLRAFLQEEPAPRRALER
jgi:hypothetical protein